MVEGSTGSPPPVVLIGGPPVAGPSEDAAAVGSVPRPPDGRPEPGPSAVPTTVLGKDAGRTAASSAPVPSSASSPGSVTTVFAATAARWAATLLGRAGPGGDQRRGNHGRRARHLARGQHRTLHERGGGGEGALEHDTE